MDAVLAPLVGKMIPEAPGQKRDFAGLIAAAGFLLACVLSRLGG